MKRVTTISIACAVFAAAAGQSLGNTCTFTAAVGDWNDADNWRDCYGDIPGVNDTAIIPNGKICRVEDSQQTVGGFTLQGGGELVIGNNKLLNLYGDSTIDGTLRFEWAGGSSAPHLWLVSSDLALVSPAGTGQIVAQSPNMGFIASLPVALTQLEIGEGLTVRGNIAIATHLTNNGTLLVDSSADTMNLGFAGQGSGGWIIDIGGGGTFLVSDGTMVVGNVAFPGGARGTWRTSETGTLNIGAACDACDDFQGALEITGGTLDVETDFCTEGKLTFSGGTINVASGKAAAFSSTCN